MDLEGLDINVLTTLCSQQLDHVTCLECCIYYVAPTTATCGHTLCRGCWYGRRQCPTCASPVERKTLQLNLPLKKLTEHVHLLVEAFEKLFNIKLDEFTLEIPNTAKQEDIDKNIAAPISSHASQDLNPSVKNLMSKVQILSKNVKIKNPTKVLHIPLPQDDWDKIEVIPDGEKCLTKDQLNVLEPMLEEPLDNDKNEYSTGNLCRSRRNRESKSNSLKESNDIQNEKINQKSSAIVSMEPSKKIKKTWVNVKKKKNKFSKLKKGNRKKLNVSIEMCKKTRILNSVVKGKVTPVIIEDITPITLRTNKEDENHNINKETVLQNSIENQSNPKTVFVDLNKKSIEEKGKIDCNKLTTHKQPSIIIQNHNLNTVDIENKKNNENITEKSKVKFIKKGALQMNTKENVQTFDKKDFTSSADDIQILIKIGTIATNICIQKKDGDIQLKVSTDQEVHTSLDNQNLPNNGTTCNNKDKNSNSISINFGESRPICKTTQVNTNSMNKPTPQNSSQKENIPEDNNDLDIFDCGMSKTPNVQLLKSTKKLPSKMLVSTQNKNIKRKLMETASEFLNDSNNFSRNKKQKLSSNGENILDRSNFKVVTIDSEFNNYDQIMGKDKDMKIVHKDANLSKIDNVRNAQRSQSQLKKNTHEIDNQKHSDNIFSIMDTDESNLTKKVNSQVAKPALHTIESLTPNLCQEFTSVPEEEKETVDVELIELGRPFHENYDSDKSVVEETPQKNVSISKIKQKSSTLFQTDYNLNKMPKTINKQNVSSVIPSTDSDSDSQTRETKENTVIKINNGRPSLETPLTINRFVDEIKHKSTPVARKTLNFNRQSVDNNDPEQTLRPNSIAAAKTTQEKEFMNEVFKESFESPTHMKTMPLISRMQRPNKLCIAGSCLTPIELAKLKLLCKEKGWSYVEKYTKDLTHLVVGVDEENKSQRSVKYMCALAAGKWIISYAWVEKCFQSRTVLSEEPFETLDVTGEPGPKRSRLARKKLFEGISFYCMQPFSVLEVDILKDILEAAGGRVVNHTSEVRVQNEKPVLLLAEPEHTQEDRFINLAMELCVVPVNYEWVLNCLGNYTLGSIHELLLCPSTLLPPETNKWPHELVVRDFV